MDAGGRRAIRHPQSSILAAPGLSAILNSPSSPRLLGEIRFTSYTRGRLQPGQWRTKDSR